jgi:putative acetyltransferase
MIFRVSTTGDLQSLERIYPAAFPDEDLLPVVRSLVTGSVDVLSLVAEDDGKVVGHVAFTICSVGDVSAGSFGSALRGPGSAQTRDRQRAGSRGVQASAGTRDRSRFWCSGIRAYYGRFGFAPERAIRAPYPMPVEWADAWQSVSLGTRSGPDRRPSGRTWRLAGSGASGARALRPLN